MREFDTSGIVSEAVSQPTNYEFVTPPDSRDPVAGGVGGGPGYDARVIFYVGVPDVGAVLEKAESLGGTRRLGRDQAPGRDLVIGQFTDPRVTHTRRRRYGVAVDGYNNVNVVQREP